MRRLIIRANFDPLTTSARNSSLAHLFARRCRKSLRPLMRSATATPTPASSIRPQITAASVRDDLDAIVQNGKRSVRESDVIDLIERWEHGDVKSIGRVAITISAALKRYPDQLGAGKE